MLALKNVGVRNLCIRHRSDIANVWNLAQSVALNLEYASLDEQNYRTTIDATYPYRLHRYPVHRDQPPPLRPSYHHKKTVAVRMARESMRAAA